MRFSVQRVSDGVELASYDNYDMAFEYACIARDYMSMGECNVVAMQCEEI